MKLIEAIIMPTNFAEVRDALEEMGGEEIMESEIISHGGRKLGIGSYRGAAFAINFFTKIKVEIVAADHLVSKVVRTIRNIAGTDRREDCRIFILTSIDALQ